MDVTHRAIVTQTHFRRQYHVQLFFIRFFQVYAVVKHTPALPSTTHNDTVRILALNAFSKDIDT